MVHPSGIEIAGMALAGLCAGAINAVVGSGTLITFPVLLAIGYPPVVANVSNTVGLVPGSAMGAYGYRRQLEGQGPRIARLAAGSVVGSVVGAVLLLVLPPGAFRAVVPVLVGLGCTLVLVGPRLNRLLARRRGTVGGPGTVGPGAVGPVDAASDPGRAAPAGDTPGRGRRRHPGGVTAGLLAGVAAVAVYGGYFGAAQGVLLIGLMGVFLDETLQRVNAAKNVLAGLTNLVAAVIFVGAGDVAWLPAVVIAAGSAAGGYAGSRLGQRLHPVLLRAVIVVIGAVTIVRLL